MQKNKIKKIEQKKIFPDWLVWSVVCVWGFIVLKNYYSVYNLNFNGLEIMLSASQYLSIFNLKNFLIFKHLFNIFLVLIFFFSVFCFGRFIIRISRVEFLNFFEEFIFSIGLGLGFTAYLIFLYTPCIWIIVLSFIVIGFLDFKRHPVKFTFPKEKLSLPDIFAVITLVIAMMLNLVGTLSPEIFYDSLVYHLGAPNYYKLHHKIINMPFVFLSNLPSVPSMLFTAGLLIKDEILSKLINYSVNLINCLILISISIRYYKLKVGIWASLIFYTINSIMISSWSCGTDTMLTFFSMFSLYSIVNFKDEKKGWLVLSGIFAGLAMSTKYTGLFAIVGVIASYLYMNFVNKIHKNFLSAKAIKNIFVWGLISSVIIAPWLVKNYIYKKNPVYPYMNNVFSKDTGSDYKKLKAFTDEARQIGSFKLANWLKHPWDITMGKISNSEYFTPLFLFLIPLLLFLGKPTNTLKYFIIYSAIIWFAWSFTSTNVRFLVFMFPSTGLIIAHYLFSDFYKFLKKVLRWIVLIVCLISVYWAGWIYYIQGGWKVVFGRQSKTDFLSATHSSYPYGYYAAAEFVNKNSPDNSKILFIGDGRSFYFNRIPVVSTAHDLTPIVEWSKKSDTAEDLYRTIRKEGITHIYFNLGEAVRLGRSYRMFEWDEKSLSVYNDFWKKYVKEIFYKDEIINGNFANRVAVYEILSEKDASVPHTPPHNLIIEVVKSIGLQK